MCCLQAGVTVVGAASLLESAAAAASRRLRHHAGPIAPASPQQQLLGIGLVLAAEAVQAGQVWHAGAPAC